MAEWMTATISDILGLIQDPPVPAENHDRQLAAFQTLLVRKVSVCGEQ